MKSKMLVAFAIMLLVVSQSVLSFAAGASSPNGPGTGPGSTDSRATLLTWTDTDWSSGNYNTSSNIEPDLTPGDAVLSSDPSNMTELYLPGTTGNNAVPTMAEFKGSLVVAVSVSPGIDIYSCDQVTLACSKVTHLAESSISGMSVSENGSRLYIAGASPLSPPPFGSVYFYNGTAVTQHEVKDATTHSMGIGAVLELSGKIYATSTDNDKRAYVYRSLDDGATWTKVQSLTATAYTRSFDAMALIGGTIYVQSDGLAPEGPKVFRYNGSWNSDPLPGMVNVPGSIFSVNGTPYLLSGGILLRYSALSWSQVPWPADSFVSGLETYNTVTRSFQTVGDLLLSRRSHTSNLTAGVVVTAGGLLGNTILDSTELYTVSNGKVTAGRAMNTPRAYHASAVLNDGTVLVAGGLTGLPPTYTATASVEKYDQSSNIWTITSSMNSPRFNHTMTKLTDGRVLVTGGMSNPTTALASAEIYNPGTNLWTPVTPMHFVRANHTAVLLQNGTVLVTGGGQGTGGSISKAEIYDPSLNKWDLVPDMPWAAYGLGSSLMSNGNVLVSGGESANTQASSVYDTGTDTWGSVVNMLVGRESHTSTALSGGTVLVTGGKVNHLGGAISTAEIYSSGSSQWTTTTGSMVRARGDHRAVQLNSTTVLLTGGQDQYLFNPDSATTYRRDGLALSTSYTVGAQIANRFFINGIDGTWSAPMSIKQSNTVINELRIAHGRLLASIGGDHKVFVAKAVSSGTLVSKAHLFTGFATNVTFGWGALLPTGTSVKFQVKSARNQTALTSADFLGPDGTNATFFTTSGVALGKTYRGNDWFQYKAILSTTDGKVTPVVQDVSLTATVEPLTLKKVIVAPANATINADQYQKFDATGYDQFGSLMKFTPVWSAEGGSIDAVTGNYTPSMTGKWMVHALGIGAEGVTSITVMPGALASIKIVPDKWTGTTDDTKVFVAHGYDKKSNLVNFTAKWAVSGGGSILQDGNFSPSRVGTWTVYANDTITGLSGNATATISSGTPANILIDPTSAQVKAGEHRVFSATVYDKDGNTLEFPVEWRVPSGGFITPQGNFTAQTAGIWKIYANLSMYKLSAQATVTVVPGPLASIQIRPDESNVKAGDALNLTGLPLDAFGNQLDVTLLWAASGGGPVSNNGQYTPTKAGTFTVYANVSGLSGSATVHVLPGTLNKVVVTPSEDNLTTGDIATFSARCEDLFGNIINGATVSWSSQGIGPGYIDGTGKLTAGNKKVTGSVIASARYQNVTVTGSATVRVAPPKTPPAEVVPAYYNALKVVIIIVLIAVAALAIMELTRKNEPKD